MASSDHDEFVVVVLAAGASRRMGTPKALVDLDGETALARVLRLVRDASLRACVVLGHHAAAIRAAHDLSGVPVADNPAPEQGQSSSVRCGARAVAPGCALALWPVDHARVAAATLQALLAAFRSRPSGCEIVVPRHAGRRGHPLLVSPAVAGELCALRDDEPAHVVVRRDPARVLALDVADRYTVLDFDRPEDLAR